MLSILKRFSREQNGLQDFLDKCSYVPIHEFDEGDTFVVGFPKSGNTWMQSIVSSLKYNIDPSQATDLLTHDLVPDVHFKQFYKRYSTQMVFKSHSLPDPRYKNVIYITRDGRDVACSAYAFLKTLHPDRNIDLRDFIKGGADLGFGSWSEHVTAWNQEQSTRRMMFLKYEDLLTGEIAILRSIAEFLGIEKQDHDLELIVQRTKFDVFQSKSSVDIRANKAWPEEGAFFRKGKKGSYKEELSAELADLFVDCHGDALKLMNYI